MNTVTAGRSRRIGISAYRNPAGKKASRLNPHTRPAGKKENTTSNAAVSE
jgi:hypothetical protein